MMDQRLVYLLVVDKMGLISWIISGGGIISPIKYCLYFTVSLVVMVVLILLVMVGLSLGLFA